MMILRLLWKHKGRWQVWLRITIGILISPIILLAAIGYYSRLSLNWLDDNLPK